LRIHHHAEYPSVHAESEVVEPHCRLWRKRVAIGVLRSHNWRVKEDTGADSVACESEDVEQREVREKAFRRASLVVKPRLRVEGERPGREIEPATEPCGKY
jgi:hypothetical protein